MAAGDFAGDDACNAVCPVRGEQAIQRSMPPPKKKRMMRIFILDEFRNIGSQESKQKKKKKEEKIKEKAKEKIFLCFVFKF